ncbi:helix-turn-helix transcriptional regulator [Aureispira sp. CCB-E]|uniref:helix-turn-helix domain-containing protein n=1 Tax=Aureispira sp. CCB-E TaxID=3051121 RepID=UPI00286909E5|nr:helix-turn-helix transcriptional regulator [Aureispira sp. CCB-E]WMX12381.1 helix-turn-helix transcriptional regulator [Aureispira sp. CCB-E]
MPVNDRFTSLIKIIDKTSNALSKDIGVTAPTIRKIEKGVTLPSGKILTFLVEEYNVNVNWLLTGKGKMFLEGEESSIDKTDSSNSRNSTCTDVKLLNDKIALLEQSIKDKEKLISMLEKNQK